MKLLKTKFGEMSLLMPLITFVLALAGLIIGSFLDLEIATNIYIGKNWWSEVVEYCGTLPAAVIIGSTGILLFCYFKNKNIKNNRFWAVFFLVLAILIAGGYWGFDSFHRHKELTLLSKMYIYGPLGVLVVAILEIPMYFLLRNGDSETYKRKALIIVFSLVFVFAFTFGIKYLTARARYMYMVAINDFSFYRPWFSFNSRAELGIPEAVEKFWIQSWPSGHSSFAALTVLSILYASANKKTEGKEWLFFAGACLYTVLVMLARTLDGHHFLSDISTGGIITILVTFVVFIIFRKSQKEESI